MFQLVYLGFFGICDHVIIYIFSLPVVIYLVALNIGFTFAFWPHHVACGIVSDQRLNPVCGSESPEILTTRPPENSLTISIGFNV